MACKELIDVAEALEGCEQNLRIFHGATGGDFNPATLTDEKPPCTFEAWKSAKEALAAIRSGKVLVRSAPVKFPEIVCLCGSTRFMQAFFEVGWEFTLQGKIVLSVGVCKHSEHHGAEALGQDVADRLDELHKRKIDLADSVFVLNVDGYIGDSTRSEIEYAESLGKPVAYLCREEPARG